MRGGRSASFARSTTTCGGPSFDGSRRSTAAHTEGSSHRDTAGASRADDSFVGGTATSSHSKCRAYVYVPSNWVSKHPRNSLSHLWRARCSTKGARRVRKGALGNRP